MSFPNSIMMGLIKTTVSNGPIEYCYFQ